MQSYKHFLSRLPVDKQTRQGHPTMLKGKLPGDTVGSAAEHYHFALTHNRVTQHPVTLCVSEWVNRLDFSLFSGPSFSLLVNGQRREIWAESMGPRSSYVSWWQSSFIVPLSLRVKLSEETAVTYTNGQTQSHGLYCAVHLGETWRDMSDCHAVSWQTVREQYWWSVQFEDKSSKQFLTLEKVRPTYRCHIKKNCVCFISFN